MLNNSRVRKAAPQRLRAVTLQILQIVQRQLLLLKLLRLLKQYGIFTHLEGKRDLEGATPRAWNTRANSELFIVDAGKR